jgi:hypothetical protein
VDIKARAMRAASSPQIITIENMELHEQADAVHDGHTLLEFVKALVADREDELAKEPLSPSSPNGAGANGWQNGTIEGFLSAASAWAESTKFGKTQGLSDTNPWRQFAAFLYCGKIYE